MKTLYDHIREQQEKEALTFGREIDMFFKKDKDIHHQIIEVLKVTLHFHRLYSEGEIVQIFPSILTDFKFPPESFPPERWIKTEIRYIRKLKRLGKRLIHT